MVSFVQTNEIRLEINRQKISERHTDEKESFQDEAKS